MQGKPTLVHYYYNDSQHWVLVIGIRSGALIDRLQYSDFTVVDPWGGAEKNLTSVGYWSDRTSVEMRTMF